MLLGSSGNETIYPTESFVQALRFPPVQLPRLEASIPDQTEDLKVAMLQRVNIDDWPSMSAPK